MHMLGIEPAPESMGRWVAWAHAHRIGEEREDDATTTALEDYARANASVTALQEAVNTRSLPLMELMLDAGLDPDTTQGDGTPLVHQVVTWDTARGLAMLIEAGADVGAEDSNSDESVLRKAMTKGPPEKLALLIEHGARIDADGNAGISLLRGEFAPEMMTAIMSTYGVDPHATDAKKLTALNWHLWMPIYKKTGIDAEGVARVRALLEAGADPNAAMFAHVNFTPLVAGAVLCNEALIRVLLEHGADPERPAGAEHRKLRTRRGLSMMRGSMYKRGLPCPRRVWGLVAVDN